MASTTSSFQTTCPCGCGEIVTATDEGFSATTIEVTACSTGRAQGIASTTWRKSTFAVVSDRAVRHPAGLVVFTEAERTLHGSGRMATAAELDVWTAEALS